ncbi:MAG: hypothetical protein U0559_16340 [Anaerolineae bacterium]
MTYRPSLLPFLGATQREPQRAWPLVAAFRSDWRQPSGSAQPIGLAWPQRWQLETVD